MNTNVAFRAVRMIGILAVAATLLAVLPFALGEDQLSDPIYRVANEAPAAQPTVTAQSVAPAAVPAAASSAAAPASAGNVAFDLTAKPGEHPLAPVLRTLKSTQEVIDRDVRDYTCNFIKEERVDGELGEKQQILLKVMQNPFSVYMSFIKPFAGREVCYVEGQNEGDMVVLDVGFKRMLGKMNLDPNGTLAMKGQKHPITNVGIKNLTAKLTKMWEAETKFAECEVTSKPDMPIAGRSATMIQVIHPVPRQDFKFYAARLFIDNELKIPIHFDAYLWPEQTGAQAPLEESYTYANMKLNNNYTAREFDSNNNPAIFQK